MIYHVYCVYYYHNDSDLFSVYCVIVFMHTTLCAVCVHVRTVLFHCCGGHSVLPVSVSSVMVCNCHTEIKGYLS